MSQENLDLVRRSVEAFNDRDIPSLESICSEDFVYRLIGGFADMMGTEFRGQDAALRWVREWMESFESRAEIETIREVNDQVLAILNIEATGATSGAGTSLRIGQVYSFRDGRISEQDSYYTPDDALKAVGLTG
jgi:ketosteroid isomerase-like protein